MYSNNDYRYYLEQRLMESDDHLAHYGVKGMKWKHRKAINSATYPILYGKDGMLRNASLRDKKRVITENVKGKKRTENLNSSSAKNFSAKKTKTAPNMYSSQKKASYSKKKLNSHYTISSGGGYHKEFDVYGQNQKKKDMKADKKMRKKAINSANPYTIDRNKSLKSNINANKVVANKRKKAKQKAYANIDKYYGD